ncbi:MAG: Rab family GTPase [Promethearchaeota archaeon]
MPKGDKNLKKYIFKLTVLGDAEVGKTSIIYRYSENRFIGRYIPTIGIDFSAKLMILGDYNINLVIWDLGGQHKYRVLRKHYLEGSRGSILVYDITNKNSFDHIDRWFNDVFRHCGRVPCILVGNKADMESKRVIASRDGEELADKLGIKFIETSAKSGLNVSEAFNSIAQMMINQYVRA